MPRRGLISGVEENGMVHAAGDDGIEPLKPSSLSHPGAQHHPTSSPHAAMSCRSHLQRLLQVIGLVYCNHISLHGGQCQTRHRLRPVRCQINHHLILVLISRSQPYDGGASTLRIRSCGITSLPRGLFRHPAHTTLELSRRASNFDWGKGAEVRVPRWGIRAESGPPSTAGPGGREPQATAKHRESPPTSPTRRRFDARLKDGIPNGGLLG